MAPAAANKQDGELRILCIDGGGIRGLIPAKILEYLESELQRIDGPTARLADYFDYIAGTSTGALITTMLTAPDYMDNDRPLYTAKDIIDLYKTEGGGIFSNDHKATWIHVAIDLVLVIIRHYDGDNEMLRFLHDMLTDMPSMEPMLLNLLNALLAKGGAIPADAASAMQLVAAAAAADGSAVTNDDNGADDESSATTMIMQEYIQEHAEAILKAMCHGRALDSSSILDGIKEFVERLKKMLTPELVRYALFRPKYDGKGLRRVVREKLGIRQLQETVTNVVVPAFDIYRNQPVIFSTSQARKEQRMNPSLSDICIAATAAPTFFPAHSFRTRREEFNLVDAGVFANNPTTVAMNEIWRTIDRDEELPVEISPFDCKRLRILSIGTGVVNQSYTAAECNSWGAIPWLLDFYNNNTQPLIDTLMYAGGSLVDYNVALLFKTQGCEQNYLRIQEDNLDPAVGAMDDASETHMDNLIEIGKKLLERQVYRTDIETRKYEPVKDGTSNKEALTKLAEQLVAERRRRQMRPAVLTEITTATATVVNEPKQKRLRSTYVLQ